MAVTAAVGIGAVLASTGDYIVYGVSKLFCGEGDTKNAKDTHYKVRSDSTVTSIFDKVGNAAKVYDLTHDENLRTAMNSGDKTKIAEALNSMKTNPISLSKVAKSKSVETMKENMKKVDALLKDDDAKSFLHACCEKMKSRAGWYVSQEGKIAILKSVQEKYGVAGLAAMELLYFNENKDNGKSGRCGQSLRNLINDRGGTWYNKAMRANYNDDVYKILDQAAQFDPRVAALALHGAMDGEGTYKTTMHRVLRGTNPSFARQAIEYFNSLPETFRANENFDEWVSGDYDNGFCTWGDAYTKITDIIADVRNNGATPSLEKYNW